MVTATTTPPAFDMGRVFERAFGVIGRNAISFLALALLLGIPNAISTVAVVAPDVEAVQHGSVSPLSFFASLAAAQLLYLVLTAVLQGALAYGTYADLSGRPASFVDCLRTGIRELLPLVGIGLLAGLGIVGGLILLVVPGVMLAMVWAVAAPTRVVEHTAVIETLRRSAALTSGHRWPIFGIYAVVTLASGVLSAAIRSILGGAQGGLVLPLAVSSLLGMLTAAVMGTLIACIYYELRSIKEGVGPEQLAAVFD